MENNYQGEKPPTYNTNQPITNPNLYNQQQSPYANPNPYNPQIPPSSNLVWGILTTLLCCLPFGVVSIVYASKVDNLWRYGAFDEARQASKSARNWAIASAVSALVIWVLYVILIFAGVFLF